MTFFLELVRNFPDLLEMHKTGEQIKINTRGKVVTAEGLKHREGKLTKKNMSPNSSSAALSDHGHKNPNVLPPSSQNVSADGRGHHFQDGMHSTTSVTEPSLRQTWDESKKFQAAQQTGQPQHTPPTLPSQAASFSPPSDAGGNVGAQARMSWYFRELHPASPIHQPVTRARW